MSSKLLNNRYRILQVLGAGGFGKTFLAEDTHLPSRRRCVIKQLKPTTQSKALYQIVKERFQREAVILEALGTGSDQIPTLYAYFTQGEEFYLVQEWVEGETLKHAVETQGTSSEATVKQILIDLLPVLDYVHQKRLIHRDIKPENVILRRRDQRPVLIDFGAVKEAMGAVLRPQDHSASSIVIGTPEFMPPEQSAGRPVYSSDLYSLALTAVYLLTGKLPQELGTHPETAEVTWRSAAPDVSPDFAQVLNKAMRLDCRKRYGTAQEMLEALRKLDDRTSGMQSAILLPMFGRISVRSLIVIGLLLASILGLGTMYLAQLYLAQTTGASQFFQAFVLGIVQGLTEFLPISSTAHLQIFTKVFGWEVVGTKPFVVTIQFGSVIAVVLYFWTDISRLLTQSLRAVQQKNWQQEEFRLLLGIAVGTLPALIGGFLLKSKISDEQSVINSATTIALASIVMALLLGAAERFGSRTRSFEKLRIGDALLVGLGQMLALVPGVSRSGSTLTAALFLGLERQTAARFSFLLGIPTLTIATVYSFIKSLKDSGGGSTDIALVVVGTVSAFIFSYLSIAWLMRFLQTQSTWIFVAYRLLFGTAILAAIYIGGWKG